ncbi:MAG TPA: 50S ribosomal protein L11 methyltransferase, partial [Thermoleophilaceae bacterium]|nr:50S ribosomal protein L11 methyltransferase [Thermoleophilaceae bacterium]
VDATVLNARANGIALERVARANLRDDTPPPADTVVANPMRPLLLRVAELMTVRPRRALIVSGLLEGEEDEVAAAFGPLTERGRASSRGWSALLLAPPAGPRVS